MKVALRKCRQRLNGGTGDTAFRQCDTGAWGEPVASKQAPDERQALTARASNEGTRDSFILGTVYIGRNKKAQTTDLSHSTKRKITISDWLVRRVAICHRRGERGLPLAAAATGNSYVHKRRTALTSNDRTTNQWRSSLGVQRRGR